MEYWERELVQALLEMAPGDCTDVTTLSKRSGISVHDIIEALAQPGCRCVVIKRVMLSVPSQFQSTPVAADGCLLLM